MSTPSSVERKHVGPWFDMEAFLEEPLIADVATNGPTVRPMDYHWEDNAFWIICGPWARLYHRVQKDPEIALIIQVSEYDKGGRVLQVMASGAVEIEPFDTKRALRMLTRYHGPDVSKWSRKPADYTVYVNGEGPPGGVWFKLRPRKLLTFNYSYENPSAR